MIRLILIRHGETIWNAEDRIQGQIDIPLNETGWRQAQALAVWLAGDTFDAIYSSDLRRALDTAAAIARPHALDVIPDPRLRQSAKGVWEGLTWDEITARYPEQVAAWEANHDMLPPGGETGAAYVGRLREFLGDMTARHTGQTVLAVGHGHVIRTFICLGLGFDTSAAGHFEIVNAGVVELHLHPGRGVLVRLNDTYPPPQEPTQ